MDLATWPPVADGEPLFARLEVIAEEPPQDAAFNMAADEALLAGLAHIPVLRIYRWRHPAVSFGYFDQFAPVRLAYPGCELVRRWTGGGVVEHGEDFTYSLLIPRTEPLTARRTEETYRILHRKVASAIIAADVSLGPVREHRPSDGGIDPASRACFANPVWYDLVLAGQKIAGAAQRRTRRGWLHQGSVQLPGDAAQIYERLREKLPAILGSELQPRRLRSDEDGAARALARQKYGASTWTERR